MAINFNMRSYLLKKGIEFEETEGNFQLVECPQCGDRRSKFGISKEKDYISHCWICDSSFTLYQLIILLEDITIHQAYRFVRQKKTRRVTKVSYIKKVDLVEEKKQVFDYDDPSIEMEFPKEFVKLKDHIPYTRQRGLSCSDILRFDLYICNGVCYNELWKNRLIIPVKYKGKLVGWQGRDFSGKAKKKIKSCKGFKKSKFIMNYDEIFNMNRAILVEGPFDVIHANSAIRTIGAFGVMGKALSNSQLNLLLKTNLKTIYIGLDPDFKENIQKTAKKLQQFFDVLIMPIKENRDLGDMSKQEIIESINNSYYPKSNFVL